VETQAEHGGTRRHVGSANDDRETGRDTGDARAAAATALGFLAAGLVDEAKQMLTEFLRRESERACVPGCGETSGLFCDSKGSRS
jgi:hypothetical protein